MPYNSFTDSSFVNALTKRADLEIFNENKGAVFALELFFSLDDPINILTPAITGGSDDAKIDVLFVSRELSSVILIQAYEAQTFKPTAKGNKGTDLSYALGVLLTADENDIPEGIRPHVLDARDAFQSGQISTLHVWFLHNCPESKQIQQQMTPCFESSKEQLKKYELDGHKINLSLKEVGLETLDSIYESSTQPITINDEIIFPSPREGFYKSENSWQAFITTISGEWIAELYKKHASTQLFSANVRQFMGANNKDNDKIINAGIQLSAKENPKNFLVYNNGITALVHDFDISDGKIKSIKGISIVNGAQSTGSLGTLPDDVDISDIEIGIRFIKCENKQTIEAITRYNNSQNKVLQSDFRANDSIQERLRSEFSRLPSGEYDGGLRGSITTDRKLKVDAHSAAQALMAWHGSPYDSYHNKMKIWEDDDLYKTSFNQSISAEHILFVYTLLEACNFYLEELKYKDKNGNIAQNEKDTLLLLNERGSSFLIIHAVQKIIDIILEESVKSPYGICFRRNMSRQQCIESWKKLIHMLSYQLQVIKPALKNRLSNQSAIASACEAFVANFGSLFLVMKNQLAKNPYAEFIQDINNKIQ
ncbi:AIPR family protein [Providencia stuartii]